MKTIFTKFIANAKVKAHLKIVILFTFIYWIAGKIEEYCDLKVLDDDGNETTELIQAISLFDAFYFSLVTQTTVGYGRISPESKLTQMLNALQLLTIFGIYLI